LIINGIPYPEKSMPDFSFFSTKTPHVTGTTGQGDVARFSLAVLLARGFYRLLCHNFW